MAERHFGFSQWYTPMWRFGEDLGHFRAAGATCLELREAKLEPGRLDEQLVLLCRVALVMACAFSGPICTFPPAPARPCSSDCGPVSGKRFRHNRTVGRPGLQRPGDLPVRS